MDTVVSARAGLASPYRGIERAQARNPCHPVRPCIELRAGLRHGRDLQYQVQRITPAPGALIRLNGHTVLLDALRAGDAIVILGQAQPRAGQLNSFLAHAITARRK